MSDDPGDPATGVRQLFRRNRWPLVAGITLIALIALYAGASAYTNRSAFCNSCHEMTPYYAAWEASPHADVSCVRCHVDPGIVAGFAHKFVALREVWVHFTGDPTFPMPDVELPNARCTACHDGTIDPEIAGFDHEEHRRGRTCKTCHDDVGHLVTADALDKAGILNAEVQAQRDSRSGIVVGNGVPLEGHAEVGCSRCHDMPASTCGACHEPPEDHFGRPCMNCHVPESWAFLHPLAPPSCVLCHDRPKDHADGQCSICHAVGVSWAFVHPVSAECGSCHTPPKDHYAGTCAACHSPTIPFAQTKFIHPGAGASCTDCHERPAGHPAGACATCHGTGTSWAFRHPSSSACANCHAAPANHYGGACSACHSPSRPFRQATFNHPGQTSSCTDCHGRPAGHPAGQCSTCHNVGGGWAFAHPSSTACANCHAAPANHYGPGCSGCHSPSRAWSSATFTHPGIPGGEHTYRSFACATCHPGGYTSYSCLACHESNNPDD